jgi:hypothetical protein
MGERVSLRAGRSRFTLSRLDRCATVWGFD